MFYIRLRLFTNGGDTLVYERDLGINVLEGLLAGLVPQTLRNGVFDREQPVRAILEAHLVGQPSRHRAYELFEAGDLWEAAVPAGTGRLGVILSDKYRLGQPLAFFTLYLTAILPDCDADRAVALDVPLSYFDKWFVPAEEVLVSFGMLETRQPVQRDVALCESEQFSEREIFPAIEDEIRQMGGEIETYNAHDLERKSTYRPKHECHSLAVLQDDALIVFVQESVLSQLEEAAAATPEHEIGGWLIGQAYRDIESDQMFIAINAQLPAQFAYFEEDEVRFSHQDNLLFVQVMEQKYKTERPLGWYHTHLGTPFLSMTDVAFHKNSWQAPWHVALVLGQGGRQKVFFYWQCGQLVPLSTFYLY
jgi:proteasome lid subunit RPN8/RPN11